MSANNGHQPADARPNESYGAYVNAEDTIGVIILGILGFILLLAYMRAQGRNRKLIEKLAAMQSQMARGE
ncbi:MAG: hypothetical protein JXQ72_04085 [Anaerolineae bacterium]|nr:hypothetical protein [Anaerolineae bacterium]